MKKIILFLSVLMLFLVGCGHSADQKPPAKKAETAVQKTASPKADEVKTAAPKADEAKTATPKANEVEIAVKEDKPAAPQPATDKALEPKKTALPEITALTEPKTFYVTVSSANVRKGPGISQPGIGVVTKGTVLLAGKEAKIGNKRWYYINKQNGWISSSVLTTKKPVKKAAPEPVVKSSNPKTAAPESNTPQQSPSAPPVKTATTVDRLLKKARTKYNSTQAMIVTARSASSYHANLDAYAYQNGKWTKMYRMPAAIGKKGITTAMHEGGMRSPAGIYYIGRAFGEVSRPSGVKLSYTKTDSSDYWIDDPSSPDYNKWKVYSGDPHSKWKSFERLRIPQYKYAAVIEYNTHPVIKGKGSAIFLHVWSGPYSPTAGCTAVPESSMLNLLRWMNPAKHPVIIQGATGQLKSMAG